MVWCPAPWFRPVRHAQLLLMRFGSVNELDSSSLGEAKSKATMPILLVKPPEVCRY